MKIFKLIPKLFVTWKHVPPLLHIPGVEQIDNFDTVETPLVVVVGIVVVIDTVNSQELPV